MLTKMYTKQSSLKNLATLQTNHFKHSFQTNSHGVKISYSLNYIILITLFFGNLGYPFSISSSLESKHFSKSKLQQMFRAFTSWGKKLTKSIVALIDFILRITTCRNLIVMFNEIENVNLKNVNTYSKLAI